jgi:sporulation protein YlmC with PRC-barrel domain
MKWTLALAPALAVALAVPVASAQTTGQQPPPTQKPRAEQPRTTPAQADVVRADRLIGQSVRDRQNERLGRINDLALNTQNGTIAYVVVNRGGLWGMGGEEVAVPWQQIQRDQEARVVRLDQQQLQQARRIDTSRSWPERAEDAVGTTGTDEPRTAAARHRVLPMSNVVGMDVHNKQNDRLGRIEDVVIARDGSVSYAVISYGGFLGMGDNQVAVPWDRLTIDPERESAMLDVTEEQLQRAPRFEHRDNWPSKVDWPFGGDRR